MRQIILALLAITAVAGKSYAQNTGGKAFDSKTTIKASERDTPSKVFTIVQQMPQFNGQMGTWFNSHLKYKGRFGAELRQADIDVMLIDPVKDRLYARQHRKVTARFLIETDGTIVNPEIIIGSGRKKYDREVLRLLKLMPKWYPGKQNGKAVKSICTFAIYFKH